MADLSPEEKSIGLRWAKVKGFVNIEGGKLVPAKQAADVDKEAMRLRECYLDIKAHDGKTAAVSDLVLAEEFYERKLLEKKTARSAVVKYTGKKLPSGAAQGGFDVSAPSANAPLGKSHPITRITNRMKAIMTELGFEEMDGSIVESSFWNFDALFQPQDHPARELADTFYLKGEAPLPEDGKLVERVKKAHEGGWKYSWDRRRQQGASCARTPQPCRRATWPA